MDKPPELPFFFDSDALIQVLLCGQHRLFSVLEADFGVRSFIMSEVEVEVLSNRKFGALVRPKLDKALRNGSLKILTSADLEGLAANQSAQVSLADIRKLGTEYNIDVGIGEAYTHAAGVMLDAPTVSNDINAIRTLESKGKKLPPTILRSYDLFAFLHTENYIQVPEAEQALKTLKQYCEWMPPSLKNSSFEDGIGQINCRLSTSLSLTASRNNWSATLYLKRKPIQ